MPLSVGGDVQEGRHPTQGKGKEHCKTSDHLLQTYTRQIIGGRVFDLDTMTRVPEAGENAHTSTIQFNNIWIDADSVFHPEEYKTEIEVDST